MNGTIPNSFVIQGTGLKPFEDERSWRFLDEASNTDLYLRCDPYGFNWSLRDTTTGSDLWSGRLHEAHEITSLLIRFGGNTNKSVRVIWNSDRIQCIFSIRDHSTI